MGERGAATGRPRLVNLGGGEANAFSLADLSAWCAERYGEHPVAADPQPRRFDIPWLIMDSSLAREHLGLAAARFRWQTFCWKLPYTRNSIREWLELSAAL